MEQHPDRETPSIAFPELSRRESECLYWVSRGKSSSDIGVILALSPRTIDSYLEKVCAKLRVRTRVEAVAVGVRDGLLDPPPRTSDRREQSGGTA